jgi:serine protein kinase
VGIGTFQPKDEKNQDSTELTGDINYRKIAVFGSDSDPRAFNFDGEFNVANRGLVEFVEVLKLDVAFLYDLLSASQEHVIKPKKFPQTHIDEVIIGHTNEPEYRKLQSNEFMEALRDRTVKTDIPYITRLADEVKIYEKDYGPSRVHGKHIAPHTLEMAAMWALLTRLREPKKASLTLLQKLKLYNGKSLPGFTEENIKELKDEAEREGMEGISPRYIQDKISNALVSEEGGACVNPFMVLNELEAGLDHHSLITSEEQRKRCRELMATVKDEYAEVTKNEVQRAICADEDAIKRLCANYIDNVKAYTQKEKVKNKYTGESEEPNEKIMRSVEEKIAIPESRKDDFRREIMNYIGALAVEGKTFDYRTNERLHRALELKLFEDQKDSIKLTSLVSNVVDKETQEKIDVVKHRLITHYGYCDVCATDVLHFVASIFARGDLKERR